MPIEDSLRSARSNRSRLQYAERDMLEEKPGLFTFPNYLECQKVFFYEDLEDEDFYVLVIKEEERAYVWRGLGFNEDDGAEIVKNFYNNCRAPTNSLNLQYNTSLI